MVRKKVGRTKKDSSAKYPKQQEQVMVSGSSEQAPTTPPAEPLEVPAYMFVFFEDGSCWRVGTEVIRRLLSELGLVPQTREAFFKDVGEWLPWTTVRKYATPVFRKETVRLERDWRTARKSFTNSAV